MPVSSLSHTRALTLSLRGLTVAPITSLLGLYRTRRALRELDARMLQDIGVTRAQADTEAQRPVWDVPAGWRR